MDGKLRHKAKVSAVAHGVYVISKAIQILKDAGIIACIAGVKALRYYGAHRVASVSRSSLMPYCIMHVLMYLQDWDVCVPDAKFDEAAKLFDRLEDVYEHGDQILPQLKSLMHTYPRFRPRDRSDIGFYIVPASEYFLIGLDESMLERSKNGIPYPRLESLAQSLVSTQRWVDLADLVDGMDLDLAWGQAHLTLGQPTAEENQYVQWKNDKILSSCSDFPGTRPEAAQLDSRSFDRTKRWSQIIDAKLSRLPTHLLPTSWKTQYRRQGSQDPRLQEDRPV